MREFIVAWFCDTRPDLIVSFVIMAVGAIFSTLLVLEKWGEMKIVWLLPCTIAKVTKGLIFKKTAIIEYKRVPGDPDKGWYYQETTDRVTGPVPDKLKKATDEFYAKERELQYKRERAREESRWVARPSFWRDWPEVDVGMDPWR